MIHYTKSIQFNYTHLIYLMYYKSAVVSNFASLNANICFVADCWKVAVVTDQYPISSKECPISK